MDAPGFPPTEALATDRGYDIVYTEDRTVAEQIPLFQSAECFIGEVASGMRGVIFPGHGTTVGGLSDVEYDPVSDRNTPRTHQYRNCSPRCGR